MRNLNVTLKMCGGLIASQICVEGGGRRRDMVVTPVQTPRTLCPSLPTVPALFGRRSSPGGTAPSTHPAPWSRPRLLARAVCGHSSQKGTAQRQAVLPVQRVPAPTSQQPFHTSSPLRILACFLPGKARSSGLHASVRTEWKRNKSSLLALQPPALAPWLCLPSYSGSGGSSSCRPSTSTLLQIHLLVLLGGIVPGSALYATSTSFPSAH